MANHQVVIGLGFGDEGKGATVSHLVSMSKYPLVVRFNGGHQAGHTVIHKGQRHVFSNFGAGTLQGAPTFWSPFCTFSPQAVLREYEFLEGAGVVSPLLFVHPLCPVVTPFDIMEGQLQAKKTNHGSVGVGFGSTLQRQEDHYCLFAQDLKCTTVLRAKLNNIARYYNVQYQGIIDGLVNEFMTEVAKLNAMESIIITDGGALHLAGYTDYIYEGAQGILLDQRFGFFPNVTRSYTTSENVKTVMYNLDPNAVSKEMKYHYVTRTYQTRHGNGFMTNEDTPIELRNHSRETNTSHYYQGYFRVAPLDVDLLIYALRTERTIKGHDHYDSSIVFTCIDQIGDGLGGDIPCTVDGVHRRMNAQEIFHNLKKHFNFGEGLVLSPFDGYQ